jgi:multiple sugar transport system permease protein
MSRRHRRRRLLSAAILLVGLVFIFVPYLWIVLTALKRPVDAAAVPPMILSPITTKNFEALVEGPFAGSLVASVIITVLTTAATMLLGVPAGYAFARGRFRGRRFFTGWLLLSRMVPPVIFIIPLFLFFHQLRLVDTFQGLTLAYLTGLLPFTVWMSASYFQDVPIELEEAARIDGAGRTRTFLDVVLPLARPGVITVGLLIAIAAWSEYFIPLILAGIKTTPATVGLVNFIGIDTLNWGALAAGALALVLPTFIVTLIAQRGMLRGLSAGAVKG